MHKYSKNKKPPHRKKKEPPPPISDGPVSLNNGKFAARKLLHCCPPQLLGKSKEKNAKTAI